MIIWLLAFRHWGEGKYWKKGFEDGGERGLRFQCRGHCTHEGEEAHVSKRAPKLIKWEGKEHCQCCKEFEGEDEEHSLHAPGPTEPFEEGEHMCRSSVMG